MQNKSDAELLRDYAISRSETAFGEIVRRYADFVYTAALRQVGDAEQARDVAQIVFCDLARKAGSLRANTLLIGWLCHGARLAALEQMRKDHRRLQRERQAMDLHDPSSDTDSDWNLVRPVLDEAIAHLGDEDRNALLLRFFKNESLASVGATLGVSEDAAQKRVSRALGKLREFLTGRGINTTGAALAAALAANAVQAAPTGFAASLTSGALALAATAGSSTAPLLKLFPVSAMKTAALILTLAGGLAGISLVRVQSQHSLGAAQALAQKQAEEIEVLRAANEQLAGETNDLAALRDEAREVLRLRGEITRLQRERSARTAAAPEPAPAEPAAPTNSSTPKLLFKAKLVSLPTEALDSLASAGLPALANGMVITLADAQFKVISEAIQGASDVTVLSQPQILTSSGVRASVAVMDTVPLGKTNAQVGVSLDIDPEYTAPIIGLGVEGKLSSVGQVSTPLGWQDALNTLRFSASLKLVEGQTLVLVRNIPNDGWLKNTVTGSLAGPKTLLVFVTPSIVTDDTVLGRTGKTGNRLAGVFRRGDTNTFIGGTLPTPPEP